MEALRSVMPKFLSSNQPKPCCQQKKQEKLLRVLDTVCRVALAALCAVVSPTLFMWSFGAGATLASSVMLYQTAQFGVTRSAGNIRPVCGQGYMEYLSNRRFPQWTVHTVTSAFIGAHVLHFPAFFVPFVSGFVGWWAGAEMTNSAVTLSQRAVEVLQQKQSCCS